ncbi:hypothetical protein GWC95_17025 [Sediminibacterium roseum]|uniref:Uncharacterized protein n=1 Tax=Sediminibacterium roseum TaxID=1978412 RepID=A0ABX0A345_9BACT|nr:hypothetical protein [Sediminibacterium roseum]
MDYNWLLQGFGQVTVRTWNENRTPGWLVSTVSGKGAAHPRYFFTS